jgi:hypothetical protein
MCMQVVLLVAQWLARITGVLLLILGLLIWAENMRDLIGVHTLLGLLLFVALLVLAGASTRVGVPVGLAAGVVVLAVIMLGLGMTQNTLLPGPNHWIIQVLHLLVGMTAVGMGEAIGGRMRRARLTASTA